MQNSSNKILLAHPGTQYSHQLAKQLFRKNLLYLFVTGFVLSKKSSFVKFILSFFPILYQKIANRIIAEVPSSKICNFPFHEYKSLNQIKRFKNTENVFFKRNQAFQELIPISTLQKAQAIIGFDTSSWILIEQSKKLGIPFILDVSIAHSQLKNTIYAQLANQYPLWSKSMEIKSYQLLEIEQTELENATHIVVASTFSKNSLIQNGVDPYKISINPYGIDLTAFPLKSTFATTNTIRFIFTGLVDARKGIPLLLDVFTKINSNKIALSIVGPIQPKIQQMIEKNYVLDNIKIWGKQPHDALPAILQNHDVFIFPSYFEGFALVILEAMAAGLPVITTTATAGPDIIQNGIEGFVIEPGNREALETAISFFINNPNQIEIMGKAARKKAEQYSWDAYGDRWEKIIHTVIEPAQ